MRVYIEGDPLSTSRRGRARRTRRRRTREAQAAVAADLLRAAVAQKGRSPATQVPRVVEMRSRAERESRNLQSQKLPRPTLERRVVLTRLTSFLRVRISSWVLNLLLQ